MDFFVKTRHWVIFSLTSGPYVLYIVCTIFFPSFINNILPQLEPFHVELFAAITYSLWVWSVASKINRTLAADLRVNLLPFTFVFIAQVVVSIIMDLRIVGTLPEGVNNIVSFTRRPMLWEFPAGTTFFMVSNLYLSFVLSKLLATGEQQQEVNLRHHIGTLFLFHFYFIGVWFVQPRINRIFGVGLDTKSFDAPLDHNLDKQLQ